MDRAYKSGAVASPPAATDNTSMGYPTAGNPQTGEMPTKPGPYWYHMMTEELVNVLAAAGITPDKATTNQLLTALQSLFVNVGGDVMTGNLTAPELHVGDANALLRRSGVHLLSEASGADAINWITGQTGVRVLANARYDGGAYYRLDDTRPAAILILRDGGEFQLYFAAAGTGSITWSASPTTIWHSGNLVPATAATANTIAQRDAAGALNVANATAAGHAVALGQFVLNSASYGYYRLPDGYIMQFGVSGDGVTPQTTGTASSVAWNLPIAFPNATLHAYATDVGSGFHTVSISAVDANTQLQAWGGSGSAASVTGFSWFAIGY